MTPDQQRQLRGLPAVGQLLELPAVRHWLDAHPRSVVLRCLQTAVDDARRRIAAGRTNGPVTDDTILALAETALDRAARPSLRRVINATGVVLHTGLGRAPLAPEAVQAVVDAASGYSNLEFDLATGGRGRRTDHVAGLLCELTGAEAATVVNNNAAATLLILNAVARGMEVIVSRGELVEIGGSFRLPEIMQASGAELREVGTTNRTRIADYEKAISERTAAIMRVHTSNYRIEGFTESAPLTELVALAHRTHKLFIDDLGSGALFDLTTIGLPAEPNASESIAAGADVVCFSGDKLLGGPQAGIILARRDVIRQIESNPLMRTYRTDKMTLAALEATLRLYRDANTVAEKVPALAQLCRPAAELKAQAEALRAALQQAAPTEDFAIVEESSVCGGGSLPTEQFPTWCATWRPKSMTVEAALAALRGGDPALIARVKDDAVLFDVRTISAGDHSAVADALVAAPNRTPHAK